MKNTFKGYASMGLPSYTTTDGHTLAQTKTTYSNSGESVSHVRQILEHIRDKHPELKELAVNALMELNRIP